VDCFVCQSTLSGSHSIEPYHSDYSTTQGTVRKLPRPRQLLTYTDRLSLCELKLTLSPLPSSTHSYHFHPQPPSCPDPDLSEVLLGQTTLRYGLAREWRCFNSLRYQHLGPDPRWAIDKHIAPTDSRLPSDKVFHRSNTTAESIRARHAGTGALP
jgi:hypothetical protein